MYKRLRQAVAHALHVTSGDAENAVLGFRQKVQQKSTRPPSESTHVRLKRCYRLNTYHQELFSLSRSGLQLLKIQVAAAPSKNPQSPFDVKISRSVNRSKESHNYALVSRRIQFAGMYPPDFDFSRYVAPETTNKQKPALILSKQPPPGHKRGRIACIGCRRRKIKCNVDSSVHRPSAPCRRCKDRGLTCHFVAVAGAELAALLAEPENPSVHRWVPPLIPESYNIPKQSSAATSNTQQATTFSQEIFEALNLRDFSSRDLGSELSAQEFHYTLWNRSGAFQADY